jgi:hypothetical protein
MIIRCRPMRPKDVAGAVAILTANPIVSQRYGKNVKELGSAWLRLLDCEAFQACVFQEVRDSEVRLIAAACSVFVSDDFVRELKTPPFFWIGPELAGRVLGGRSPVLQGREFSKANTGGGLNLVLWHVCIAPKEAMRSEVRAQVSASFFEYHRGFLLKELIALQATFAQEVQWTLEGGGLPVSPANGHYVDSVDSSNAMYEPHLFGLTRELAENKMSWISSLFLYEPPRVMFSNGERKLLAVALRGVTDQELSDELAISLSGVKKVWRSIYKRASEQLDSSILNVDVEEEHRNGDRGKQKKQRLLAYLREHPEELRPYSRKAQKRSLTSM